MKISDHPDGRVSIDDILKQTELEFRVRDSQVILYPGEEIPSFLSAEMVVELQLFDVQVNVQRKLCFAFYTQIRPNSLIKSHQQAHTESRPCSAHQQSTIRRWANIVTSDNYAGWSSVFVSNYI